MHQTDVSEDNEEQQIPGLESNCVKSSPPPLPLLVKSTKESIEQASKKQRRGDTFGVAMDVSLVHSLTVQTLGGFRAFFFGVAAAAGPFRFLKPETTPWELQSQMLHFERKKKRGSEPATEPRQGTKGWRPGGWNLQGRGRRTRRRGRRRRELRPRLRDPPSDPEASRPANFPSGEARSSATASEAVAFLAGFERLGDGVGKWRKMFSLHRPRFPAISARAAAAPKVPFLLCVRPFFSPQSMGQSLCGCILGSNSPLRVYEGE